MKARLFILALGTFAIGTDGFVIAGVLPAVASSLGVSLSVAGQLMTVFSLVYAAAAPALGAVTGRLNRKSVLLVSIVLFSAANFASALAPSYALLMATRVIAALGAALFTPTATTTAALLAPPERRGRALGTVIGGLTVAIVVGVPLGTWISGFWSWRAPFVLVGALGVIAALCIAAMFKPVASPGAASLSERLQLAGQRPVLLALLLTSVWTVGGFTVYTYLSELLSAAGLPVSWLSPALFLFGIASVAGSSLGGAGADRIGAVRTLTFGLIALCVALAALGAAVMFSPSRWSLPVALGAVIVWGAAGWVLTPPQQHRLLALAGPSAGIVLSLNSSAIYLGMGVGSLVGGLIVQLGSLPALGLVGGAFQLVALVMLRATAGSGRKASAGGSENVHNIPVH
ncbi:MFS transporter [Paenibacillus thermotolerans]|uniref:MFS transporter n=1 Tax=Paenibacillus thermotolerans TaxID=3027807 RepID=UPI0023689715|nr:MULTISPECIES: MFS transporter [unclassified Paenibacillus]